MSSSSSSSGIVSSLFGLITGGTSSTTDVTSSTNVNPFAIDTMSSSANVSSSTTVDASNPQLTVPSGDINLLEWHKLLASSSNALNQQLQLSDTQSMGLNSALWAELGATAVALRALQQSMAGVANAEISGSTDYNTNTVTPYNSFLDGVSATSNAMYVTQQQYAAGQITTAQYNAAVDQWNANVGDLNTQLQTEFDTYSQATSDYNAQAAITNGTIDQINAQLTAGGNLIIPSLGLVSPSSLTLLPTNLPHGPPPPATPTVPASLGDAPQASAGLTTDVPDFLNTYFSPIFETALASLSLFNKHISLQDAYRQFQYFTLAGGKTNKLPNDAYRAPFPNIYFNNQGATNSTISGVGLTASILGLSSRVLTTVIARALFAASAKVLVRGSGRIIPDGSGTVIPDNVITNAVLLSLSVLEKSSLNSALPALALVSGGLNPNQLVNNPASSAALGLANLNGITGFLDSGTLESELTKDLISAGFTKDQANAVLPSLTAAVSIGLLQFGVTQLSISQGLPGLLPQILGNLPNVNLQQQLIVAAGNNFSDFFKNEINVLNLKSELTNELVQNNNISQSIAENAINQAVNATISNQTNLTNTDNFQAALQANLTSQGLLASQNLNATTTADLTQTAANFVSTEQQLPGLDTTFNQQAVQEAALNSEIANNENVQSAINQASLQENITNRDFLKALTSQFIQQGNDQTTANLLATQVLASVQSNSFSVDRINKDVLNASILAASNGANPDNLNTAVDNTIALAPQSEFQFRQVLTQQLQNAGVSNANNIAINAGITQTGNNPLTSPTIGDFLSRDALASQLVAELNKQFSGNINASVGASLGNQLVLSLIGPTTTSAINTDDIQRPTSVLNRLNDAYSQAKVTLQNNYDTQIADNFTDFIAPKSVSFVDFADRIKDVGQSAFLLFSGIMYQGMGRKPTNFKESIDIPI